jgi:hypothetical protein
MKMLKDETRRRFFGFVKVGTIFGPSVFLFPIFRG